MNEFSDWSRKRFLRWLYKNHPKPESRWVEITINVNDGSGAIEKTTMADDYETCMHELAFELALHHREKDVPEILKAEFPKPASHPWSLTRIREFADPKLTMSQARVRYVKKRRS